MLDGPFYLNGKRFERNELISYCWEASADPSTSSWQAGVFRFILDFLSPGTTIVQKTSGTTGKAKQLDLRKDSMLVSAKKTISRFELGKQDSALLCLPVDYIAGKMMVVRALSASMNLVTVEARGRPLEGFRQEIDLAAMVPLQVYQSIRHGDPLEEIKVLLIGGSEIHPDLRRRIEELRGTRAFESFATSETCSHIALRALNGPNRAEEFSVLEGIGINRDERGCLLIDAPGIAGSTVVTNDLVELNGKTGFRWLGRIDNLIKSGGLPIIPEEIERKIIPLIEMNCMIVPVPDVRLGQRPVLAVETGKLGADKQEIARRLEGVLTAAEQPRSIVFFRKFPVNASFKYDRLAVARRAGEIIRKGK